MASGLGNIKKDFLTDGIKFDADKFYMHANHTDFQMEAVPDQNWKEKEAPETQKSRECCSCSCTADNTKKYKPKKGLDHNFTTMTHILCTIMTMFFYRLSNGARV